MKDPTKGLFRWVLGILIALFVVMIPALIAVGSTVPLAELSGSLLSSLVSTETVYIMLFFCLAVVLAALTLSIFVFWLAKPLFRKWMLERKERKRLTRSQSRFSGLKQMDEMLKKAEKLLFEELAVVLEMAYDDVAQLFSEKFSAITAEV